MTYAPITVTYAPTPDAPDAPAPPPSDDRLKAHIAAVNGAGEALKATWITLLSLITYLFVAVGSTTHQDLLLEKAQKMPILGIDLPLLTFYAWAPVLLLVIHGYYLVQFFLLSLRLRELQHYVYAGAPDAITARLAETRTGLDSGLIIQYVAGRGVSFSGPRAMIALAMLSTSVAGPLFLLLSFQITFLPYHSEWITSWHRLALLIDLGLLMYMWPRSPRADLIGPDPLPRVPSLRDTYRDKRGSFEATAKAPHGMGTKPDWMAALAVVLAALHFAWATVGWGAGLALWLVRQIRTRPVAIMTGGAALVLAYFCIAVANFPGEHAEKAGSAACPNAYEWVYGLRDTASRQAASDACLTALLFNGPVDFASGRVRSLFGRHLVLPGLDLVDAADADVAKRMSERQFYYSFVGRDLVQAVIIAGDLRGIRFDGADLSRAQLAGTRFKYSSFGCVDKDGSGNPGDADDECARLDKTVLGRIGSVETDFTGADLQAANFIGAQLDGAVFANADARRADLSYSSGKPDFTNARLDYGVFDYADYSGASFRNAKVGGASFRGSSIQNSDARGADFARADLSGADMAGTFIGTDFERVRAVGTSFGGIYEGASFFHSLLSASSFQKAKLVGVKLDCAELNGAKLGDAFDAISLDTTIVWRTTIPGGATSHDIDTFMKRISPGLWIAGEQNRRILTTPSVIQTSCEVDDFKPSSFAWRKSELQKIATEFRADRGKQHAPTFDDRIKAAMDRVAVLDPALDGPPGWNKTNPSVQQMWDRLSNEFRGDPAARKGRFCHLLSVACKPRKNGWGQPHSEPQAASGIIRHYVLESGLSDFRKTLLSALKDPTFCPNATGLPEADLKLLADMAERSPPANTSDNSELDYRQYADCVR